MRLATSGSKSQQTYVANSRNGCLSKLGGRRIQLEPKVPTMEVI